MCMCVSVEEKNKKKTSLNGKTFVLISFSTFAAMKDVTYRKYYIELLLCAL